MPRPGLPALVATDLDGTLVRSDDTVSAYAREVLDRCRATGVHVVGATGRGPRLLELTRRDIPAAGHLVLADGGRVVDVRGSADPRMLVDHRLDGPALAALLDELETTTGPLTVVVEARDGPGAPLWADGPVVWPWPERVETVSRERALRGETIKVMIRADGDIDTLMELAESVIPPAKATITQAGLGYVEICPPGVDKATGLAVVAGSLGVGAAEVLVFGDMPNDAPMFAWAGWRRIAVGNAHPRVRALADETVGTNDEDGVAVRLERLLAGRG